MMFIEILILSAGVLALIAGFSIEKRPAAHACRVIGILLIACAAVLYWKSVNQILFTN